MQRAAYLLVSISFFVAGCGGDGTTATPDATVDPNAPVLASIGDKSVLAGNTLMFTATASDANNDSLTFTATATGTDPQNLTPPATFTINQNLVSANFSWTPNAGQVGDYVMTFTVTDNSMSTLSDSETITISVLDTIGFGRVLYDDKCESCHGPDGRFGSPGGEIQCIDNATYFATINSGTMAQYAATWSTVDKDAVLYYLQNVDSQRCI